MLPDKIMQSNLLDILFENRNKNYGAYALRKFYNRRMRIAISATIFLSTCLAIILSMHHNKNHDFVTTVFIPPDVQLSNVPVKPEAPQPSRPQSKNNFRQINNSPPIIANEKTETTQPTIAELDNNIISTINKYGDAPININAIPAEENGHPQPSSALPVIDENVPLVSAEVMPEFPGGVNAMVKFILKNIHQPDDLQSGEMIRVVASFIVSKTGSIENLKIISSGRADLDKEVLRVINKMPLWNPGMQNGKAVSVYFSLPVTFKSTEE